MYMRHYVRTVVTYVITFHVNLETTSGLSILLHGVISLPDATSYDIDMQTALSPDWPN